MEDKYKNALEVMTSDSISIGQTTESGAGEGLGKISLQYEVEQFNQGNKTQEVKAYEFTN